MSWVRSVLTPQVTLNTDKLFEFIIRNGAKYVLNDTVLEEVVEIKDLGIYYDSLLLFDKHVTEKSLYDAEYN